MNSNLIAKFKQQKVPLQKEEKARIKIIQGPEPGSVFVIKCANASIGRGEENLIFIPDLKMSRKHAELIWAGKNWKIKDLGSANGIKVNSKILRESNLNPGDRVQMGESIFEFLTPEVGNARLMEAPPQLNQILLQQKSFQAQTHKIQSLSSVLGSLFSKKSAPSGGGSDSSSRKKFLIIGVVGLLLWVILDDSPSSNSTSPSQSKKTQIEGTEKTAENRSESGIAEGRDLAGFLPEASRVQASQTVEAYFLVGFREYREGNYLRAKRMFESILQIDATHKLSKIYLENSNRAIQEEVKFHLEQGRRKMQAGRLKEAKGHFETVTRLLFYDQKNAAFGEARKQIEKIKK